MSQGQRNFSKHADTCSSRSSISSHSSLQHHHHVGNYSTLNNSSNVVGYPSPCGRQANLSCICPNSALQYNHPNSSSLSDNGSCNLNYNQESRGFTQIPCNSCCSMHTTHHMHNAPVKCQASSMVNQTVNPRLTANVTSTPVVNRNTLFYNTESVNNDSAVSCCNGDTRNNFPETLLHHHHHAAHGIDVPVNTNIAPLQPADQIHSFSFHRYNVPQPSATPSAPNSLGDQNQRTLPHHCNYAHRAPECNHHRPPICCSHHIQTVAQQQVIHDCGNCSHSHNELIHHKCNSTLPLAENHHIHYAQESTVNQYQDSSNNDSLLSTAHTHNLSNSSTTTHTSNVAVKHQPQFHQPMVSRAGRSNSSQQYEQYGQSSAASTSSATASLSSYHMPSGFDDLVPLYPSNKIHQPLPPPPMLKSRSTSPSQTVVNTHNTLPVIATTFLNSVSHQPPHEAPTLPPLPPKPISPNASSCSTQITTVRTSPSLQNQPITRVTSQAGVQHPLPDSDVPPPLPPLNPGSRTQPLIDSLVTKFQNITDASQSQITDLLNLNLDRNAMLSEAERKTQALTKQVELELEQQINSSEPHGICPKCGIRVMSAQEACKAMNQIYHANCFVCCECNRTLLGKTFYPVGDKVYCEEDFKVSRDGNRTSLCRSQ